MKNSSSPQTCKITNTRLGSHWCLDNTEVLPSGKFSNIALKIIDGPCPCLCFSVGIKREFIQMLVCRAQTL